MMKKIIIRASKESDTNTLIALSKQLGYIIESKDMENNIMLFSSNSLYKIWVAEVDDHIVGYIAATITYYFHRKDTFLQILSIVVDEKYRNLGIGKKLIQTVENYAREMNCLHVELSSNMHRSNAHEFYKNLGYIELNNLRKFFKKELIQKNF